jgi:phosphoglycerate dehydrogenase-like enzyme
MAWSGDPNYVEGLWDLENLLITYHIASGRQHEAKIILNIIRENLGRYGRGNVPLRNQIDKKQGF